MNEIDEKNQAPVQQECLKEMIQNGHARRMGSVEDLYVALNRQNLYRNFCTYGELSDYCTRDQLTLALREICLKNPTLYILFYQQDGQIMKIIIAVPNTIHGHIQCMIIFQYYKN